MIKLGNPILLGLEMTY